MGVAVSMLLVLPQHHCLSATAGGSLDVSGYSLIIPFDSLQD